MQVAMASARAAQRLNAPVRQPPASTRSDARKFAAAGSTYAIATLAMQKQLRWEKAQRYAQAHYNALGMTEAPDTETVQGIEVIRAVRREARKAARGQDDFQEKFSVYQRQLAAWRAKDAAYRQSGWLKRLVSLKPKKPLMPRLSPVVFTVDEIAAFFAPERRAAVKTALHAMYDDTDILTLESESESESEKETRDNPRVLLNETAYDLLHRFVGRK